MNHPFVDGYRRVAFSTTDVFPLLSGYRPHAGANNPHRFPIGLLENNQCNFGQPLSWMRTWLTCRESRRKRQHMRYPEAG